MVFVREDRVEVSVSPFYTPNFTKKNEKLTQSQKPQRSMQRTSTSRYLPR
jgi:hypothetical protein